MKIHLLAFLFLLTPLLHGQETPQMTHVKVAIDLECPMSPELQSLIAVIPKSNAKSKDFKEWTHEFVTNMKKLTDLVESGKVGNATFTINIETTTPELNH